MTSKALERMRVPYHIVIEPQEYAAYAAVIDQAKILCLPFSNLGQGSIPARNWVWDHAQAGGAARHWILDDNIAGFVRLYQHKKVPLADGTAFRVLEDFVERYENISIAGLQYRFFAKQRQHLTPLIFNTRVYSCLLIETALSLRWRGRYNEDTDLSLRVLKRGLCTVLCQAFLCNKIATMQLSGGNTDNLYQGDGRLQMALSLQRQHPDVVRVARRWNRWQHVVDYRPFKGNQPRLKPGVVIATEPDEYGLYCVPRQTMGAR